MGGASDGAAVAMDQLLARFVRWAMEQPEIRGAIVVGSRARRETPADEFSDLDIVVVTTAPDRLLGSAAWLDGIAPVLLTFVEETAVGGARERRALFEDGLDVDFTVLDPSLVQQMIGLPETRAVVARGARVVLDKDGALHRMLAGVDPPDADVRAGPDVAAFDEVVHDFLYHVVWAAKKLARGEVWSAATCLNGRMAWLLLRMIEWHARAADPRRDTWHGGRFLERWADPLPLERLRDAFARYDAGDTARALRGSAALFARIASDVAGSLGADYPTERHMAVLELTERYLALAPRRRATP